MKADPQIVFFGTPDLAVTVLDELEEAGIVPDLIVTAADKPAGRGMKLTPPPVKVWADEHGIPTLQPEKLDDVFTAELKRRLTLQDGAAKTSEPQNLKTSKPADLFIVFAYGKIIPKKILEIPEHGTINLHPSLLPRLRGPSPMRSAILTDEKVTGVSIILMDEKMDHGPILAQASIEPEPWPPRASKLEEILLHEGGKLLAEVIPLWLVGEITPEPQDESKATYSKLFTKEDGLINLADDGYQNLLKIRALEGWPGAYFFYPEHGRRVSEKDGRKMRVKIIDAHLDKNGALVIDTVIPEGGKAMPYPEFLK